jgi:hypothetical protein
MQLCGSAIDAYNYLPFTNPLLCKKEACNSTKLILYTPLKTSSLAVMCPHKTMLLQHDVTTSNNHDTKTISGSSFAALMAVAEEII